MWANHTGRIDHTMPEQVFKKLPNNYKAWVYANNNGPGIKPVFAQVVKNAIKATDSDHTAFMFFNMNLTARIEVFRPQSGWISPLKEDTSRWSPLTFEDIQQLDNVVGADFNNILFCRISFYDESLVQGLNLPIVDKYFNMIGGGSTGGISSAEDLGELAQTAQDVDASY